ncbi:MAG: hypothetical protein L6R36_002451 [Xanthoria steineri]|nr:MAG: hypothetical protein L6R36_002451 [Xanthoria steineri]
MRLASPNTLSTQAKSARGAWPMLKSCHLDTCIILSIADSGFGNVPPTTGRIRSE